MTPPLRTRARAAARRSSLLRYCTAGFAFIMDAIVARTFSALARTPTRTRDPRAWLRRPFPPQKRCKVIRAAQVEPSRGQVPIAFEAARERVKHKMSWDR